MSSVSLSSSATTSGLSASFTTDCDSSSSFDDDDEDYGLEELELLDEKSTTSADDIGDNYESDSMSGNFSHIERMQRLLLKPKQVRNSERNHSNSFCNLQRNEELGNLRITPFFTTNPPEFFPLVQDEDPDRALSFTVVENSGESGCVDVDIDLDVDGSIDGIDIVLGGGVEVFPTSQVDIVMPLLRDDWKRERAEWERLQEAIKWKQHHTKVDIQQQISYSGIKVRRNRSEPGISPLKRSYPVSTRIKSLCFSENSFNGKHYRYHGQTLKHKQQKYGKHPDLPFPSSKTPNPIVTKSSKKIGKKHAQYALTAGMMLGIRESVGGAMGVEADIESGRWDEWEKCWEVDFEREHGINNYIKKDNPDDTEVSEEINEYSHGTPNTTMHNHSSKVEPNTGMVSSPCSDTAARPKLEHSTAELLNRSTSTATTASTQAKCSTTLIQECQRVSKYTFPAHQFYMGSNPDSPLSKPLPHKYKFKVYASVVFARIRSLFGLEKQAFLHSICGKFNFYEFASNARSGQFFFYSHDGRYMIKTLSFTESKFLREILPYYYRHLSRYPHTFLTHFYGMYRVCMPDLNNQRLHFVIMKSVFSTENKIDRVWDLKGSKTNRKSKEGDAVGKDLDIIEEGRKLRFVEPGAKKAFLEQLRKDATFLARLGIMDYSLLLGLHNVCEGNPEVSNPENESDMKDEIEPSMSNTPYRRDVLKRAGTNGAKSTGNDGFEALEALDQAMPSNAMRAKKSHLLSVEVEDKVGSLKTINSHLSAETEFVSTGQKYGIAANHITSRSDRGIEGYGKLEDGTVSKREIYYCGIIDILQYYNARKIGETVMRQAVGDSMVNISCVDPESYGKRFVKFISTLVEE